MQLGFRWALRLAQDARFAVRHFRGAPSYAIFTILVLALGIGTVTAMFTIAYAVLWKPFPFQADRGLFQPIDRTNKDDGSLSISSDEMRQWQLATKNTADVAFNGGGLNVAEGPGGAVLITEVEASPNLFSVLGTQPTLGRTFHQEEQATDHSDVAVISDAIWRETFGADRAVIGKTLHIGPNVYSVIGVMPPHFEYPLYDDRPEVWVPLDRSELAAANIDSYAFFAPLVRVHSGVSPQVAEAQLTIAHMPFAKIKASDIHLESVRDLLVADVRPAMLALEVAVGVVWLIACSNVAGLMLARVRTRRAEIAVRAALGAGRRRILAQLLSESLLLSCVGAVGGLALAVLLLRIFRHMAGTMLPLASNIQFSWVVWTGLLALTAVTAFVFGVVPAFMAAQTNPYSGLRSAGRKQAGDRGQGRARAFLVVGQVALSITLLIGAGLMMRTIYALKHVPLGFRKDHLLLTSLTVPNTLYQDRNVGTAVWQPLLDQVRQLPGVREAALSTVLPIRHPVELITVVYATAWTHEDVSATVRAATPGLMDVLGISMRSGRFFTDEDTATGQPVVVVNQMFVNRYLGGSDPLGRQFRFGHVPRAATIVGVIDDIHQDSVAMPSQPEFYLSMSQLGSDDPIYRALLGRFMELAVGTEVSETVLVPELRRCIQKANPHLAIGEFTSMVEAVDDSIGAQRLAAAVIGVFGSLVLLITVVGLYGLLNFMVAQRTQEIGIRMALGANRTRVVGLVLWQTGTLIAAGTLLGVFLAIVGHRLLQNFLFGVSATDPWTITAALASLILFGLLAAVLPARRAATINPVHALRAE
jgi:predicted permease